KLDAVPRRDSTIWVEPVLQMTIFDILQVFFIVASFLGMVFLLRRTSGLVSQREVGEEPAWRNFWTTTARIIAAKKRLVLLAATALILSIPTGYYTYYGLICKEHFYHGRPTSYWYH